MLETLLLIFVTAAAGLVAFLIVYARWQYGTLEKLGIPVAKPHFMLGSDPDGHKIVYQDRDIERFKKFGPVFGVYENGVPTVFVVEPDMIYRIMVKDFDHFFDRRTADFGDPIFDNLLDFLPGEKWKTVRAGITPMFTSSRIKNGGKMFMQLTDKYLKKVKGSEPKDRTQIDVKALMTPVFVEFVCEYFLCIKLALEGTMEEIKQHFVYKMVMESVFESMTPSFMFTIMGVFPFTMKLLPIMPTDGIKKFLATLEQILKTRKGMKKDTSSGKDFIDVMMSMLEKIDSPEFKRLGIDKVCVEAQAFEMFMAGYDSIIGNLQILSYYVARDPKVQEKLLEEVDCFFSKSENENGGLGDLQYLTACIKEALRLSPSFHRPERSCMKEWTYINNDKGINVTIPKGMKIVFPSWVTNRHPDVFKDPEEFRPERFYESGYENEKLGVGQYANLTFGHGPRQCPGSRMGIEMAKAGMVMLLKDHRFEMRHDTKAVIQEGIGMITRYKPFYVDFVKRTPSLNGS